METPNSISPEGWLKENCDLSDWNKLEEQLKDSLWTNNVLKYMEQYRNSKSISNEEIKDKAFLQAKEIKGKINRASFYDGYIHGMKAYRDLNKSEEPKPDKVKGNKCIGTNCGEFKIS
jgi:hypothetical protein